jgi:hypothetical protein
MASMRSAGGLADRLAASALRLYLLIKGQRRLADYLANQENLDGLAKDVVSK